MQATSPMSRPIPAIVLALCGLAAALPEAVAAEQLPGSVAGERIISQLGGSTRFSPPVQTVDELKAMAASNRADLETVLAMAGLGSISGQVIEAMTSGAVTESSFAPGGRIEWMALRRSGRPDLIRSARWGGDEPFTNFSFTVDGPDASYDFVVPKVCGNLSLVAVRPRPVEPAPPPPPPPAEEPVPPPPPPEEPVQRQSPWYVGVDVGYVSVSNGSYDFIGAAVIPHRAKFDGGWGYFLQAGRYFGQGRLELEYGRRKNDADEFGSINNVTPARGSLEATSLMFNALYDFRIGERWLPYLGVGLGGANIEANRVRKAVSDPDRTGALLDDDNRFAWQLLAGIAYELNERWALKLDYRYFDAGDVDFKYGVGCNAAGADCIFIGDLDESYDAHSFSAGFRYRF